MNACTRFVRLRHIDNNRVKSVIYGPLLRKSALARSLRLLVPGSAKPAKRRDWRRTGRRREQAMDFGRISRRRLLQGSAALTLGTALGARQAAAADTTIGFLSVGWRARDR